MKQKFISIINNFFTNMQNRSTKESLIFISINFSFLLNGFFLLLIGMSPTYSGLPSNTTRIILSSILMAIWFITLPILSSEKKDKLLFHLGYSSIATICLYFIIYYWIKHAQKNTPILQDLGIIILSVIVIGYFLYLLINFVKIIASIIKKLIKRLLPSYKEKHSGLLYVIESITSIFIAISSFIAAIWGVITAFKSFINN